MNEREQSLTHASRLEWIAEHTAGVDARRELRYAATFLRALADRPEPAQPVAQDDEQVILAAYDKAIEAAGWWGNVGGEGGWLRVPTGRQFFILGYRAAPSHPAPSDAAPEQPMFHCKRHGDYPIGGDGLCPTCKTVFVSSLNTAQPAKGEGK